MAEHEREQPDHVLGAGFVREHGTEMREIDLRLAARRGLEADLERGRPGGPDIAQEVGENCVAAGVAEIAQLAMQSATGQLRKGGDALAQIALEPQ